MNIILGCGFDNISFGMFEPKIIEILGLPDKRYQSEFDLCIQYYSIRCELCLEEEENRLHWIECSHPKVKIFNEPIINKNKDEVIPFLSSQLNDELEYDDYQSFETYLFQDNCLKLEF